MRRFTRSLLYKLVEGLKTDAADITFKMTVKFKALVKTKVVGFHTDLLDVNGLSVALLKS